jgi:Family of unknown function (DUF6459)
MTSEALNLGPSRPGAAQLSPLRRMPLPSCEPPYDDELGPAVADWSGGRGGGLGVQGTLALAFVLPSGLPAVPEPPAGLQLVDVTPDDDAPPDEFGPLPTRRAALPAPQTWAGRVVQAIVEVLAGVRPATQLVRWTTDEVYEEIASRVLATCGLEAGGPPRGVVSSLHVSEPADGVAEVCALVRRGSRSTAVALRLEGMDGRWQCTALELG